MFNLDLAVQAISFGAFLWLAFFIVSRADRQRPQTILTFLALFSMACLFFSLGMINHTRGPLNPLIARLFWWSDVVPVAFWLHIAHQIVRQEANPVFTPAMYINYIIAVTISVLGSITDLFLVYSTASQKSPGNNDSDVGYYYAPGVLYPIYVLYLVLAGLAVIWFIFLAMRRERDIALQTGDADRRLLNRKLVLLVIGAVLFFFGALYQTLRQQFYDTYPVWEWPGHIVFLAGLAMIGFNVAQYGLMVMGKDIQRDFFYSVTGVILINLLYVGLLGAAGNLSPQSLLLVIALATTTHTLYDFFRELLDRLFFSKAEQQARSEAWAFATALASNPVNVSQVDISKPPPEPPADNDNDNETGNDTGVEQIDPKDEKNFYNIVRRSITSLKNPTQLVRSPLLSMRLLDHRLREAGLEDNRLNRATVLREVLLEYIERLRPEGLSEVSSTPGTGDAWRFYNVLYFPYVRQISRKTALAEARRLENERKRNGVREASDLEQVLNWLTDVDEDTFYKWQRRASDTIASFLREEEMQIRV
jgi:hypothetical protein